MVSRISIDDDLTISIGGASTKLSVAAALTAAEDITRKAFRYAMFEEAAADPKGIAMQIVAAGKKTRGH
jgi:hypothetical protein